MKNLIKAAVSDEEYEKLLQKSLSVFPAEKQKLRISRALSSEKPVCVFLGASVTRGFDKNEKTLISARCFPNMLCEKLNERLSTDKFCDINLSVCGSHSLMGSFFVETRVRDLNPDIVFVEYAINESLDRKGIARFESLIRKLLSLPSSPAVVIVSVFTTEFYTCEEYMTRLAEHYGLMHCGMFGAFGKAFKENKNAPFDWLIYSEDEGHPTPSGHELISDCLLYCLLKAAENVSPREIPTPPALPAPFLEAPYEKLRLFPYNKAIADGFSYKDGETFFFDGRFAGCGELKFDLVCRAFCFVFLQYNDPDFGNACIFVDGKQTAELQGYSIFGWGNPIIRVVLDENEDKRHTICLKTDGNKTGKACRFEITAAGYVAENENSGF